MQGLRLGLGFNQNLGGFNPSQIDGLIAWYDASDTSTIVESGGAVSQWNDKSGNGNNATQGIVAAQPVTGTRTINGLNALDFDGSAAMSIPHTPFNGASGITAFIVAQADTIASADRRLFQLDGDSYFAGTYRASDNFLYGVHRMLSSDSFRFVAGTVAVDENPFIFTNSSLQNGTPKVYYTGSSQAIGGALSNNPVSFSQGAIGDDNSGGITSFDGRMTEVLFYSRELASEETNQIGAYLGDKWGITWTDL